MLTMDVNFTSEHLIEACKKLDEPLVQRLLKIVHIRRNVDARDKSFGFTALHHVLMAPNFEDCNVGMVTIIKHLLDAGADTNAASWSGKNALHLAISGRREKNVIRYLLDHGANPEARDKNGDSALHLLLGECYHKSEIDIVQVILDKSSVISNLGGFARQSALHLACQRMDIKTVQLLIEKGAKVNARLDSGDTPLHQTLGEGYSYKNDALLKLLLHAGACVNEAGQYGLTALHLACNGRKTGAVKVLLLFQAQVAVKDDNRDTPLHLALSKKYKHPQKCTQLVKILLKSGALTNGHGNKGVTPMHLACDQRYFHTVKLLLDNGGTLTERDNMGNTPLHYLLFEGYNSIDHLQLLRLLLSFEHEINAEGQEGLTLLHLACDTRDVNTISLLIKHGASLASTDKESDTPLHHVLRTGYSATDVDAVKLLLDSGADVDAKGRKAFTPLGLLISSMGDESDVLTIQTLLDAGANVFAQCLPPESVLSGSRLLSGQNIDETYAKTVAHELVDRLPGMVGYVLLSKAGVDMTEFLEGAVVNWVTEAIQSGNSTIIDNAHSLIRFILAVKPHRYHLLDRMENILQETGDRRAKKKILSFSKVPSLKSLAIHCTRQRIMQCISWDALSVITLGNDDHYMSGANILHKLESLKTQVPRAQVEELKLVAVTEPLLRQNQVNELSSSAMDETCSESSFSRGGSSESEPEWSDDQPDRMELEYPDDNQVADAFLKSGPSNYQDTILNRRRKRSEVESIRSVHVVYKPLIRLEGKCVLSHLYRGDSTKREINKEKKQGSEIDNQLNAAMDHLAVRTDGRSIIPDSSMLSPTEVNCIALEYCETVKRELERKMHAKCSLKLSGSVENNIKVGLPDECDFLLEMTQVGGTDVTKFIYQMEDPMFFRLETPKGLHHIGNIKNQLYSHLKTILDFQNISHFKRPLYVENYLKYNKGPGVCIRLSWQCGECHQHTLDIDITPVLALHGRRLKDLFQLPDHFESEPFCFAKADVEQTVPVLVLHKAIGEFENDKRKHSIWKLSFNHIIKIIYSHLDKQSASFKSAMRLLKVFRDLVFPRALKFSASLGTNGEQSMQIRSTLSSFVLQNLLFLEITKTRNLDEWNHDLTGRIISVLMAIKEKEFISFFTGKPETVFNAPGADRDLIRSCLDEDLNILISTLLEQQRMSPSQPSSYSKHKGVMELSTGLIYIIRTNGRLYELQQTYLYQNIEYVKEIVGVKWHDNIYFYNFTNFESSTGNIPLLESIWGKWRLKCAQKMDATFTEDSSKSMCLKGTLSNHKLDHQSVSSEKVNISPLQYEGTDEMESGESEQLTDNIINEMEALPTDAVKNSIFSKNAVSCPSCQDYQKLLSAMKRELDAKNTEIRALKEHIGDEGIFFNLFQPWSG